MTRAVLCPLGCSNISLTLSEISGYAPLYRARHYLLTYVREVPLLRRRNSCFLYRITPESRLRYRTQKRLRWTRDSRVHSYKGMTENIDHDGEASPHRASRKNNAYNKDERHSPDYNRRVGDRADKRKTPTSIRLNDRVLSICNRILVQDGVFGPNAELLCNHVLEKHLSSFDQSEPQK